MADELSVLGVPTHGQRFGSGVRTKATRSTWRAGRIRNMVVLPIYRGEQRHGRNSKVKREVISATIEGLVSPALWQAAQETFARHRICAKNTLRVYPLRGVMACSTCGLNYVGSTGRDGVTWYRCGGQVRGRGRLEGRCPGRAIRGDHLELVVWQDVERLLRRPGDLLDQLATGARGATDRHTAEEEAERLHQALMAIDDQQRRAVGLAVRGAISDSELDGELVRIAAERAEVARLLAAVAPSRDQRKPVDEDLLERIRTRLKAGLSDEMRQEVVRLLVGRIVIRTTVNEDGSKDATATISYRFPAVLKTRTDIHASPDYTLVRRVVELPSGRRRKANAA